MTADFMTVLWKEWKEIVMERSSSGAGSFRPLILVGVLGVAVPLRMMPDRYFSVAGLLMPVFFAAVVITAVIADSFAGERERHTLETLLATRLSDRAILFGKIAACIAYGWVISLLCIVAGSITSDLAHREGEIHFFHDTASWLVILLGPPLVGGVMATGGVLISLHAATVRQAQQTLSVALAVGVFATIFGSSMVPESWRAQFLHALVTWSPTELVLAAAAVLLAIDLVLLAAGMARFQRSKLVLD